MIKKASLSVLVVLILVLLSPVVARATGEMKVLSSSVDVDFPTKLAFRISATSGVNITDIRLSYRVERMTFAQVISEAYVVFRPASKVDALWEWDMRKMGGLPPGSVIEYLWTVKDAAGNKLSTDPTKIQFDDKRFAWKNLTRGKIILYWYSGDEIFADKLMAAAQQAAKRLADYAGAELAEPARIYIYGNTRDLQGSMIFPREWTGGVAFTRYNIIAIGIAPDKLDWGSRAIAHELTHLVIQQMTFNPYGDLPNWLNEGLAMYAEGELEASFLWQLSNAVAQDTLITVRSLSSPFSAYGEPSSLAYAQSYSLVQFLVSKYGQGKMYDLLDTFKRGSGYDDALRKVYGFDMDGLDALWRDYIGARKATPAPLVAPSPTPVVPSLTSPVSTPSPVPVTKPAPTSPPVSSPSPTGPTVTPVSPIPVSPVVGIRINPVLIGALVAVVIGILIWLGLFLRS